MNRIIILSIPLTFAIINCVLLYFVNKIFKSKVKEFNDLYVENQRLENRIDFLEDRIKVQKAMIEDFVKDGIQESYKVFINGKQNRLNVPISKIREQNESHGRIL